MIEGAMGFGVRGERYRRTPKSAANAASAMSRVEIAGQQTAKSGSRRASLRLARRLEGYGFAASDRFARMTACNANVSVCLMIESRQALEIAEDLAALPGVDCLSFGRMDLAQSWG